MLGKSFDVGTDYKVEPEHVRNKEGQPPDRYHVYFRLYGQWEKKATLAFQPVPKPVREDQPEEAPAGPQGLTEAVLLEIIAHRISANPELSGSVKLSGFLKRLTDVSRWLGENTRG